VSDDIQPEERQLQGDIEALRALHPETQDLYREVCVLLFFRHGITPTANKLYQLVRKGSMSAPAEALARFWETLREKSRVRIEHPDLPVELRDAAGEVIGALWQRAQALANESLAAMRAEAQAAVMTAKAQVETAEGKAASAEGLRASVELELTLTAAARQQLEQDLAREQGLRTAIERQLGEASQQRQELQQALAQARQGFERQLEEQRSAAQAGEDRHQADLKRALLDVDRERTIAAKLQKDLEQARRAEAEQADRHRADAGRLQSDLAHLRQKLGELEGALTETRAARDKLSQQFNKALTAKLSARKVAMKGSAKAP
jgi:chromosome segregation ATPase